MTRDEFKRRLNELRLVFFNGLKFYEIWKALFPTEERVNIINRYKAFFPPVMEALRQASLMQFAKVLDRDSRTISLPNLVQAAKKDRENLAPNITEAELNEMDKRLCASEKVSGNLKSARNQILAHTDANPEKVSLLKGQLDKLIEDINSVFNQLSQAHDGQVYALREVLVFCTRHTEEILRRLGQEES